MDAFKRPRQNWVVVTEILTIYSFIKKSLLNTTWEECVLLVSAINCLDFYFSFLRYGHRLDDLWDSFLNSTVPTLTIVWLCYWCDRLHNLMSWKSLLSSAKLMPPHIVKSCINLEVSKVVFLNWEELDSKLTIRPQTCCSWKGHLFSTLCVWEHTPTNLDTREDSPIAYAIHVEVGNSSYYGGLEKGGLEWNGRKIIQ